MKAMDRRSALAVIGLTTVGAVAATVTGAAALPLPAPMSKAPDVAAQAPKGDAAPSVQQVRWWWGPRRRRVVVVRRYRRWW